MAKCPNLINGHCAVSDNDLELSRINRTCTREWTLFKGTFRCGYYYFKLLNDQALLDLRRPEDAVRFPHLAALNSDGTLNLLKTAYAGDVQTCPRCNKAAALCHIHSQRFQKAAYILQEGHGFGSKGPFQFHRERHGPVSEEIDTLLDGQQIMSGWLRGKEQKAYEMTVQERNVVRTLTVLYTRMGYYEREILASYVYSEKNHDFWTPKESTIHDRTIPRQVPLFTQSGSLAPIATEGGAAKELSYLERLVSSLKGYYAAEADWKSEEPLIREALNRVLGEIEKQFVAEKALGIGSSGILLLLRDRSLHDFQGESIRRVLKMPRPRGGEFKGTSLEIVSDEISTLCSVKHENLVPVVLAGQTTVGNRKIPWYIMEFIDKPQNLEEFVRGKPSATNLIGVLLNVAEALNYLHSTGIVHCDVKKENILVKGSEHPRAYLSDLGYAHLMVNDGAEILVRFTQRTGHPFLRHRIVRESDPAAATARIRRSDLRPDFDRYAFGMTVLGLLETIEENELLDEFQLKHLRLIILRLLCGYSPEDVSLLPGVGEHIVKEIIYRDTNQLVGDLRKLGI